MKKIETLKKLNLSEVELKVKSFLTGGIDMTPDPPDPVQSDSTCIGACTRGGAYC